MGGPDPYSVAVLPPEVVLLLVVLGGTSLLAVVLFLSVRKSRSATSFQPLLPHPSQPMSILVFVALPMALNLIRLAMFPWLIVVPLGPINSPRSWMRYEHAPVDLVVHDWDSPQPYEYPRDAANLTVKAATRVGLGSAGQRARAVRDLAWWTAVCPNYAPFTLPRFAEALGDPDPKVRSAAVAGLGSVGGHASPAVADLLAARGSSVAHFDHLIDHAVRLIRTTRKWPAEDVCEDVSRDELERRAVQQGHEPDEALS
jgi:hypothetical protein